MVPNVFDILYLDGETLIDLPFAERRKLLEKVVTTHIAPQVVSGSEERKYRIPTRLPSTRDTKGTV